MIPNYLKYLLMFIVIYNLSNETLRVFLSSTLIFWITIENTKYYKKLPPGPWGIPILGVLPFVYRKPPHLFYLKMSEKYGDVFSVQMGNNLVVGLGSRKLLKKFFNRDDSTFRPHTPLNGLLGGLGIMLSEGILWKKQRQFLHEKFRALGVKLWANSRFEKKIITEVEELLHHLENVEGQTVKPYGVFGRYIHNVICLLMMSFRFKENDKEFNTFNETVSRGMKLFGLVHIGEHVEAYLRLPGKKVVINEIRKNIANISKFHSGHIMRRVQNRSISAKSEPADLLDHYLNKIDAEKNPRREKQNKSNIFPGVDPEKQMVQVMNDLFSAGMETSLNTLLWTLVMMMREPTVAENVRKELNKVVAPGELITMAHRLSLPYVEAVLFETMRLLSIVPLGTTHVNATDWKIRNYVIPAGTHIVPLLIKMNMDPRIYPEPERFIPERFIRDGKFHVTDTFMQFGVGQRMCLGNLLARMELFLFFANVMHNFDFCTPDGEEIPGLEGTLATTHAPPPFTLCFKKLRNMKCT